MMWLLPMIGGCILLAALRLRISFSGQHSQEVRTHAASASSESLPASLDVSSDVIDDDSAGSSPADSASSSSPSISGTVSETDFPFLGVYRGSDSDYLTLDSDGTASYYCSEYTDLFCPWTYENDEVSLYLPKLHCTIRATVSAPCQELFFAADNLSWNDENFTRTDDVPEIILRDSRKSNDNAVTVLEDGTRRFRMGSFSFSLPSQFIDYSDSADTNNMLSDFVSVDVQNNCYSLLVFYNSPDSVLPFSKFTVKDFSASSEEILSAWYDGLALGEASETSVAGKKAYCRSFSGRNNRYFTRLSDDAMEGIITSVYDDASGHAVSIIFAQTKDAVCDESKDYESMLQSAELE